MIETGLFILFLIMISETPKRLDQLKKTFNVVTKYVTSLQSAWKRKPKPSVTCVKGQHVFICSVRWRLINGIDIVQERIGRWCECRFPSGVPFQTALVYLFQSRSAIWCPLSLSNTFMRLRSETYRFIDEGAYLSVDDHEQDPEQSGAQRQSAQALFILQ